MFIDFGKMKTVNGRNNRNKNKVYNSIAKQTYPSLDNIPKHSSFHPILQNEIQKVQLDKDIENFENLVFYTMNGEVKSSNMEKDEKQKQNEKQDESLEDADSDDDDDEQIQLNVNYSTHMYVGAITVVGLFVFYRMLQKTK
jgi:hypothetical protein